MVAAADNRSTVREIQAIVAAGEDEQGDRLGELAEAYAEGCEALNQRVYDCVELLRKGQRAEAVGLAKRPPEIREELYTLDFLELGDWIELCEREELRIPDILDVDAATSMIDELYAESDVLNKLLTVHRRMALGQAPLTDRIRILRRIAQEDPGDSSWAEDLRAYEKARLQEMVPLAERADAEGNIRALEALLGELRTGEWLEKPPRKFVRKMDEIAQPHRQRAADVQYTQLLEEIREAHGAMDEARCREALSRWDQVLLTFRAEPIPAQAEQVAPVREWLGGLSDAREEEARFELACSTLDAAIDEEKDQATLEKLAADVLRQEQGMPELLAARFNSRMEELRRAGRRRFAVTVTSIVVASLLIAGGVAAGWVWNARRQERRQWQTRIAAALNEKDIGKAGKLFSALQESGPGILASPEIQDLHGRYQAKLRQDNARKAEFDGLLKKLSDAGVASAHEGDVSRAEGLARTYEEKLQVQRWRENLQRHKDALAEKRDKDFERQIEELEGLYAKLRDAGQGDGTDFDSLAGQCRRLAASLTVVHDVSEPLRVRVQTLDRAVASTTKEVWDRRMRDRGALEALETIKRLCTDPEALEAALKRFVRQYPGHSLSQDFSKAASVAPHWRAAAATRALIAGWKGRYRIRDATAIKDRLAKVQAHLKKYPVSASREGLIRYADYLQVAAKSLPGGQLMELATIKGLFDSPLIADARVVRTTNGRAYYVLEPKLRPKTLNSRVIRYEFDYVVDATFKHKRLALMPSEIENVNLIRDNIPAAPHCAVSQKVLRMIKGAGEAKWETLYLRLAEEVRAAKGADAILQASMLKLLLEQAAVTSPFRAEEIRAATADLSDLYLDVPWMDPDDTDARRLRPQAKRRIGGMKSLLTLIGRIENDAEKMTATLCQHTSVGVILADGPYLARSRPNDARLCVFWGQGADPPSAHSVGRIAKGSVELDRAACARFPKGTPIFAEVSR